MSGAVGGSSAHTDCGPRRDEQEKMMEFHSKEPGLLSRLPLAEMGYQGSILPLSFQEDAKQPPRWRIKVTTSDPALFLPVALSPPDIKLCICLSTVLLLSHSARMTAPQNGGYVSSVPCCVPSAER